MNNAGANNRLNERTDLIPIGEPAPEFTAQASDGKTISLTDFRGRRHVVLVFYPGDNTPLCTAQLCAIRDTWSDFEAQNAVVFGVNPAGEAKHAGFVGRHRFPFPLLVDAGNAIAAQYGCKGWFGLVKRSVYVIDTQGRVVYAKRGNPAPAEILAAIVRLQDNAGVIA